MHLYHPYKNESTVLLTFGDIFGSGPNLMGDEPPELAGFGEMGDTGPLLLWDLCLSTPGGGGGGAFSILRETDEHREMGLMICALTDINILLIY